MARQRIRLVGGAVACAALLLPVVASGVEGRVMPPDPDVDAFATWAAPVAPKSGGALLRTEPLDRRHAFFEAMPDFRGTAVRVLYATVDGNGDPATSTGVVIVPDGTVPRGGWPVVAWAHGTVGVSDCTAPSRTSGPDVIAGGYASTWAAWLKEGYAVVASDYAGHGTQGETFYVDGRSQAYNTADLLRAARQLPQSGKVSSRYVVIGHSQGGQTAVFAAAVNAEYAPELRLVGTIALSPAVGWTSGAPRIQDRRHSVVDGSHPLARFEAQYVPAFLDKLLAGFQAIDFTRGAPGRKFEPSEYFTKEVIDAAERVKSGVPCTMGSVPKNIRWALRSEDPDGGLLQDPAEAWLPFVARFEPPLDPAAYDVPLYILTGMADPLTPIRSIQPFADAVFAGGRVRGGLKAYGYAEIGPRSWLGDHFGFELEQEPFADSVAIVHRLLKAAPESSPSSSHLPPAPYIRDGTHNEMLSTGKLRGRVLRVKRPLLLVRDLDRSIRFYVDVIGLELYGIEPSYDQQPQSLGYPMFNIKPGSRKRMATLNTSDEVRGLSLQEVLDMDWAVQEHPRTSTILFESDDVLGMVARVKAAGHRVIEPLAEESPPALGVPGMRFIEAGVIDPDGHVIAFFQYYPPGPEWDSVLRQYGNH